VPGGQDAHDAGAGQHSQAGRDVYAAARDQTVINDSRRLAAGAVPHPAAVDLSRPMTGLPRRPARVFAGRDQALDMLARALEARGGAVVTQAIYGLGGVGKSELALQYAHARRRDYSLLWWITAADPGQAEAGLAALAGRLCPPVAVAGTTTDTAGWATGWLQAHDRWLLILDNVEDPADIEPLLGQLGSGHVIITSRRDADWSQLADPVRLDVLTPGAATQVLTRRTGQHDAADADAAAHIAAELGYLPLALDQAAAYPARPPGWATSPSPAATWDGPTTRCPWKNGPRRSASTRSDVHHFGAICHFSKASRTPCPARAAATRPPDTDTTAQRPTQENTAWREV
jgi:hypothetical protein